MLHDEVFETAKVALELYSEIYTNNPLEYDRLKQYDGEAEFIKEATQKLCTGEEGVFYFNEVTVDKELLTTALEFFKNKLLRTPFEKVLYVIHAQSPLDGIEGKILIWAEETDYGVNIVSFVEAPPSDKLIPCFWIPFSRDLFSIQREGEKIRLVPAQGEQITARALYVPPHIDKDKSMVYIQEVITYWLAATLALGMPHYEHEDIEISEKLNKARSKRGKPALRGYTKVSLHRNIRAQMQGGCGGWHTKPHWRRGHIRTLSDGRKVPVRPCMVNFKGDAELEKNVYKVTE